MNSRFINFIIGGCYLGDHAQAFHDKIRKALLEMYEHLMTQWKKVVERREKDD